MTPQAGNHKPLIHVCEVSDYVPRGAFICRRVIKFEVESERLN